MRNPLTVVWSTLRGKDAAEQTPQPRPSRRYVRDRSGSASNAILRVLEENHRVLLEILDVLKNR